MATSANQMCRNQVVTAMLCNMVLRREELSAARWGDIGLKDGKITLRIEEDFIEMPRSVLALVDRWRTAITGSAGEPAPHSPLIRRIWKGGRVAKDGLSPDGIWLIIRDAARFATMNHVTPDDLRRSSVAKLRDDGVPLEDINRLLRHRSTLITERFLAKLPTAAMDAENDEDE
jgi:integrase